MPLGVVLRPSRGLQAGHLVVVAAAAKESWFKVGSKLVVIEEATKGGLGWGLVQH